MTFEETRIPGAFVLGLEPSEDERGLFARTFCEREFRKHGIEMRVAQCNLSRNLRAGTLRGMHYSVDPGAERKVVRCTRGRIYDVLVDLRPGSDALHAWVGVELTADSGRALYVPEGVAHGFLTLEDDTDVLYQMSEFYDPSFSRGVRWDDPAFGIEWPRSIRVIATRDASYPDIMGREAQSR